MSDAVPSQFPVGRRSFTLRAEERGHTLVRSQGPHSSYLAGHPEGFLTRESSFNFHEYQGGRPGFGVMRVFGDETFHGVGCGYNIHRHHNFVICAFVLQGELTHINTAGSRGMVDQLRQGDYYVFSAGAGGKHCELNVGQEELNVIYIWFLPSQLYLPPSFHRGFFDFRNRRNRLEQIIGEADGALPIPNDIRVSRLAADAGAKHVYKPRSQLHGTYVFVIDGGLRCGESVLKRRDSSGVCGVDEIQCETVADATDALFVEVAMKDDEVVKEWERAHPGR